MLSSLIFLKVRSPCEPAGPDYYNIYVIGARDYVNLVITTAIASKQSPDVTRHIFF